MKKEEIEMLKSIQESRKIIAAYESAPSEQVKVSPDEFLLQKNKEYKTTLDVNHIYITKAQLKLYLTEFLSINTPVNNEVKSILRIAQTWMGTLYAKNQDNDTIRIPLAKDLEKLNHFLANTPVSKEESNNGEIIVKEVLGKDLKIGDIMWGIDEWNMLTRSDIISLKDIDEHFLVKIK